MSHALALAVLRELTDGRFHSGEAIGARLGVTRSAISLAVQKLTLAGLAIDRVTGRGYRVRQPPDWLHAGLVQQAVAAVDAPAARELRLRISDLEASTNTTLARDAARGAATGTALACEWQLAGRGRLGRGWVAPPATNLTVSLLWRFPGGATSLSGLSLAVSVAVARALARHGLTALGVKWPNDLLVADRKCGGILIETQGDVLGPIAAVIGIGLNLQRPPVTDAPVAGLADLGLPLPGRSVLLGTLLGEVMQAARHFASAGFDAATRRAWAALDAYPGREGWITVAGSKRRGRLLGIDATGALQAEIDGQRRVLPSAEIVGVLPDE